MSTVLIRQIADDYSESTGLAKYNRSRMPGCKDTLYAAYNDNTGRYITGLDEESPLVKTPEEKEKIKALRLQLEEKIRKDLSGASTFWQTFGVVIDTNSPRVFNTENAVDVLSLTMLKANAYVAPSKEDAFTIQYKDAQYFAYTEESEAKEEMSSRKKRDEALAKLYSISTNKDKMLLYGQYLEGFKYNDKLTEDMLYKMLRAYIEDKEMDNTKYFLEALKTPVEEIQHKIIVDKALKNKFIKRASIGGKKFVYQYGQVTLGTTLPEVYKNLSLPDFATELFSLTKELKINE